VRPFITSFATVGSAFWVLSHPLAAVASNDRFVVTERVLVDMRDGVLTPDGRHGLSLQGASDTVTALVVDGRIVKVPPGFVRDSVAVSPDGSRVAYEVEKGGGRRAVVLDGAESRTYESIISPQPVFSPDGRRLAYIAAGGGIGQGTEEFPVVDGVEGKRYGEIGPFVLFSPDSRRVLFIATEGNRRGIPVGRSRIVLDGVDGAEYSGNGYSGPHGNITFSPDSKRLAFTVWDGRTMKAVVDAVEGRTYERVRSLGFSPDSRRVGYAATVAGRQTFVVDGSESQPSDAPGPDDGDPVVRFSPDSRHVSYRVRHGSRWAMVIDGAEGKLYDALDPAATFSADGKRTVYFARTGDNWIAVVDGVESGPAFPIAPVFSPDSKHVFYFTSSADRSTYCLVEDGKPGVPHKGGPFYGPIFSPDGRHLAYVAQTPTRNIAITLDGRDCPLPTPMGFEPRIAFYMSLPPFFFKDSKNLRYIGMSAEYQKLELLEANVAIK